MLRALLASRKNGTRRAPTGCHLCDAAIFLTRPRPSSRKYDNDSNPFERCKPTPGVARHLLNRLAMASSPVAPSPKVTAIVSTYASAQFLRGCLDDLLAQTLYAQGNLEILVIDSGSPEDESDIVREYQRLFAHIRLERTERETLYASWNRAIDLATGAYLTNANTDDRHRPDALELLASHLDGSPDTAVVYADSLVTTVANETWDTNTAESRLDWPTFSYAELQRRCIVGPQPMWRKALHARWGPFDPAFRVAGDYEFWLRIGKVERIDRYPGTLGLYYRNPGGLEHGSGSTRDETSAIQRRYAPAATFVVTKEPSPVAAENPMRPSSGEPLVSVIMPTYNRPDFLARALSSLCKQTFTDFEVVVVNDCGEPVEGIVQSFADRLQITYVRHARNRDRSAARNTGIRASRGKYIAYLDDDDAYRAEHLELLVHALRAQGACVAYTEAEWVEEERIATGYRAVKSSRARDATFSRDRLMVQNYIPILSVMHERTCMDEVGMFDESLATHEDWDLFIRFANRYRFVHVASITADVSMRNDGSSTTSAHRSDFLRTLRLIHTRYRHLIAERPDLLADQAKFYEATAPLPAPEPEVDVYDKAYAWGWANPALKDIVYLCYKTPNLSENARRFYESDEFKSECQLLRDLGKGPETGVRVLDVGCGNGVASYALARAGYQVTAIDSSNGTLAGVRAAEKLQGLDGVTFKVGRADPPGLHFPDGHFDVIWMREVLHHIKDLPAFLCEAHRVLRPGGLICCFRDTVIWNEEQRKDFFEKHPFYHITKDEGAYYLDEYRRAFRDAGFSCERELNPVESPINTFPGPCNPMQRFDEASSRARRTGYDLFSFFYRKPRTRMPGDDVTALVEGAIRRFNDFQARLGASGR